MDRRVLCPSKRPNQLYNLRPLLWVPHHHWHPYSYIVLSTIQLVILVACINLWVRDIKRRGGACINFVHSHQAIILMLCSVFSVGKVIFYWPYKMSSFITSFWRRIGSWCPSFSWRPWNSSVSSSSASTTASRPWRSLRIRSNGCRCSDSCLS